MVRIITEALILLNISGKFEIKPVLVHTKKSHALLTMDASFTAINLFENKKSVYLKGVENGPYVTKIESNVLKINIGLNLPH